MSSRRGLPTAVLLCLAGAFVVLVAAGRVWASAQVPAGPLADASTLASTGADLVPGVRALGLVGLAGVVALAATRRGGRIVVGVLLLLTGVGVAAAVLTADLTTAARRGAAVPEDVPVTLTAWPWCTVAGGGLLVLAGLLTALRGRGWAALGQRYEAPAGGGAGPTTAQATTAAPQQPTEPLTEKGLWEALDRGEDPTANLESLAGPPADREADRT